MKKRVYIASNLKEIIRPYFKIIGLLCVLNLIPVELMEIWLYSFFVENILTKGRFELLLYIILAFIGAYLLKTCIYIIQNYLTNKLSIKLCFQMKCRLFQKITRYDFNKLIKYTEEEFKAILERDTEAIVSFVNNQIISMIKILFYMIGIPMVLILINLKMFLICAVVSFSIFSLQKYIAGKFSTLYRDNREISDEYNQVQFDNIRQWKEVKSSIIYDNCINKFDHYWSRVFYIEMKTILLLFLTWILEDMHLFIFGKVIMYLIGLVFFYFDNMSIGMIVLFINLFQSLINYYNCYSQAKISFESECHQYENIINNYQNNENDSIEYLNNSNGDINIYMREFKYPSTENVVFKEFDFHVKKNEKVILIGESGVGKSTLVKLLAGFYGVEGNNVRLLQTENARFIYQESTLFNISIIENIRLGRPEASDDKIKEICYDMEIDQFVLKMEKGYDTIVGENGCLLSGGQKQRIILARLLVSDAAFYILDEATASLDFQMEQLLLLRLNNYFKNKTVLFITHGNYKPLSYDSVYKLKDKKIYLVERKRHEDTMLYI